MDKLFIEFLDIGPSEFCCKHCLQVCHLCNRIECSDNNNPIVIAYKKAIQLIKQENKTLDEINKVLNEFEKLKNSRGII